MHNVPPGLAELRRREPLVRAGPLLRMAETKRLLHIADYTEYVASHPADSDAAAFAKLNGARTILEVPMLNPFDDLAFLSPPARLGPVRRGGPRSKRIRRAFPTSRTTPRAR